MRGHRTTTITRSSFVSGRRWNTDRSTAKTPGIVWRARGRTALTPPPASTGAHPCSSTTFRTGATGCLEFAPSPSFRLKPRETRGSRRRAAIVAENSATYRCVGERDTLALFPARRSFPSTQNAWKNQRVALFLWSAWPGVFGRFGRVPYNSIDRHGLTHPRKPEAMCRRSCQDRQTGISKRGPAADA